MVFGFIKSFEQLQVYNFLIYSKMGCSYCFSKRGLPGIPGGPGLSQLPGNTLAVSPEWLGDATVDPSVQFTSVAAATAAAASMGATAAEPIEILIYPGTYVGNITLPPNVYLNGQSDNVVVITGNITHSSTGGIRSFAIQNLRVSGDIIISATGSTLSGISLINVIADDLTITTSNTTVLDFINVNLSGNLTLAGGGGQGVISNINVAGNVVVSGLSGTTNFVTAINLNAVNLTTSGSSSGSFKTQGGYLSGTITIGANTILTSRTGILGTVAATGTGDIRGANYNVLNATGIVNRTLFKITSGTLPVGTNAISITPVYSDASYNVFATQLSGTFSPSSVNNRTASGFDFATGENNTTWEFVLIRT